MFLCFNQLKCYIHLICRSHLHWGRTLFLCKLHSTLLLVTSAAPLVFALHKVETKSKQWTDWKLPNICWRQNIVSLQTFSQTWITHSPDPKESTTKCNSEEHDRILLRQPLEPSRTGILGVVWTIHNNSCALSSEGHKATLPKECVCFDCTGLRVPTLFFTKFRSGNQ